MIRPADDQSWGTLLTRRGMLGMLASGAAATLVHGGLPAFPRGMLTRPIHSSGEMLPVIGLGTWQAFDVRPGDDRRPLEKVLTTFVRLGGKLVDSSPMYGRAESVVGDIAAAFSLRRSLFLATKVWTSGARAGVQQMEASSSALRTASIDLMQIHNLVDARTHLPTLHEWKRTGRIRYLGITHYQPSGYPEVERLLRNESLDFLQINYSIAERGAAARILPLAHDRGVAVIANRPFAGR